MSIYGPKIRLPKIRLPKPRIPKINPKKVMPIVMIIAILIIILIIFSVADLDFNPHIQVNWKNNPLDLKSDLSHFAELNLTLVNTSEQTTDITVDVTTESDELIIFCEDASFPNVAPGKDRKTRCIVRRNPNEKIFSGTYSLNITTNLGSTKTDLIVNTN